MGIVDLGRQFTIDGRFRWENDGGRIRTTEVVVGQRSIESRGSYDGK